MASERILELLRRPSTAEEHDAIRELWKTHSKAEDNRDIAGLLSTLTRDCVYTVAGTGARWEGHEGATRSRSTQIATSDCSVRPNATADCGASQRTSESTKPRSSA